MRQVVTGIRPLSVMATRKSDSNPESAMRWQEPRPNLCAEDHATAKKVREISVLVCRCQVESTVTSMARQLRALVGQGKGSIYFPYGGRSASRHLGLQSTTWEDGPDPSPYRSN